LFKKISMAKKVNSTVPGENNDPKKPAPINYADLIQKEQIRTGKIIPKKTVDKMGPADAKSLDRLGGIYEDLEGDYYDEFADYVNPDIMRGRAFDYKALQEMRFENQTIGQEIGHGLGRIALNVVPAIIGGTASMLDIQGYWDAEHAANNAIVNWADSVKKSVDEELLPIYTDPNGDTMDLTSSAWWASRGSGLVESVLAFAAQGAGLAKGLSLVGKGIGAAVQGEKLFNFLSKMPGVTSGANAAQNIGKGLETVAHTFLMNQSEAVIEASQVYHDIYQKSIDANLSIKEAKQQAADAASTTMQLNRLNMVLNLTSSRAFLSNKIGTRMLQEAPEALLRKVGKESLQEAGEELINHVASKAGMAKGEKKDYGFSDAIKDIGSLEGFEAAFLGALGGSGQTAITHGLNSLSNGPGSTIDEDGNKISKNAAEQKSYDRQQEVIEAMKKKGVRYTDVLQKTADFVVHNEEMAKAAKENDVAKWNELNEKTLANQVLEASETGTVGILQKMYEEEAARPVEEVGQEYVDNAKKAIKDIVELERIYNNFEKYPNASEIYINRADKLRNDKSVRILQNATNEAYTELNSLAKETAKKYKFKNNREVIYKKEGEETHRETKELPDSDLIFNIHDLENNPGNSEENKKTYEKFLKELKATSTYQKAIKQEEELEAHTELGNKINEVYNEITSSKYQQTYAEEAEKQKIKKEDKKTLLESNSLEEINSLRDKYKDDPELSALANIKHTEVTTKLKREQEQKEKELIKHSLIKEFTEFTAEDVEEKLPDFIKKVTDLEGISQESKDEIINRANKHYAELMGEETEEEPEYSQDDVDPTNIQDLSDLTKLNKKVHQTQFPHDIPIPKKEKEDVEAEAAKAMEAAIENELNIIHILEDGTKQVSYNRIKKGSNTVAILSKEFEQFDTDSTITREEVDNTIIEENKAFLLPETFSKNSEVTLEVIEDYSGDVYDPLSTTKEKMPWSVRLEQIKTTHGENYKRSNDYIGAVPIKITDKDGNTAYIHETHWINSTNVFGNEDTLKKDRQDSLDLRKTVIEKGIVKTKIDSKTNGVFLRTKGTERMSVAEAMPDKDLILAVGKDGNLESHKNVDSAITNTKPVDGRLYAVVPMNDGSTIPIPLERKKLSEESIETVYQLIKAYLTGDPENELVQNINNSLNINVLNISELRNILKQYLYTVETDKISGLESLLSFKTDEIGSGVPLITITSNSIEFGRPGVDDVLAGKDAAGNQKRSVVISRSFQEKGTQEKRDKSIAENLKKLEKFKNTILPLCLVNADRKTLTESKNAKTIKISSKGNVSTMLYSDYLKSAYQTNIFSVNAGTDENPRWVYTIQPVIKINTKFVVPSKKTTTKKQTQPKTNSQTKTTSVSTNAKAEIEAKIEAFDKTIENEFEEGDYFKVLALAEKQVKDGTISQTPENIQLLTNYPKLFEELIKATNARNKTISEFDKDKVLAGTPNKLPIYGIESSINPATGRLEIKWVEVRKEAITNIQLTKIGNYAAEALFNYKSELQKELAALENNTINDTEKETTISKVQELANDPRISIEDLELMKKELEEGKVIQGVTIQDVESAIVMKEIQDLSEEGEAVPISNLFGEEEDETEPADNSKIEKVDDLTFDFGQDDAEDDDDDYSIPTISQEAREKIKKETDIITIKGISPAEQQSLLGYLAGKIINAANLSDSGSTNSAIIFTEALVTLKKLHAKCVENNLPNKAKKIKNIIDQYNKVIVLSKARLDLLGSGKFSADLENLLDTESDDLGGGLGKSLYTDDWAFTINSKHTASANLRKFFAVIPNMSEPGKPVFSNLGFPEYVGFDTVYDTVHRILAGSKSDYATMVLKLKSQEEKLPWLNGVISSLENASDDIQSEFVSDMTKHHVKMSFIMWSNYGEPGKAKNYSLQEWSSNASSMEQKVKESWGSNLKSVLGKSNLLTVNGNGDYVFDQTVVNDLLKQVEEWKKTPLSISKENMEGSINSLAQWLGNFGIVLSDATYKDIILGKYKNGSKVTWSSLFTNSNSFVTVLAKELSKKRNLLFSDVELLNDTAVKKLAKLEAYNNISLFSNAFQAGKKTIYSYGNNNYLVNRIRDLKQTDIEGNYSENELINKLKKLSFTQDSLWLNMLSDGEEGNNIFKNFFEEDYLSLEALKRLGSTSKNDRKLNNLTEAEHEVVKLAYFLNASGEKGFRKATYLYPSMSDKSTMMLIRAVAYKLDVQKDEGGVGRMSKENLDTLYKALILPEIKRIQAKQASNVNGYEPNAFYFLPNLNYDVTVDTGNSDIGFLDYITAGGEVTKEIKETVLYPHLEKVIEKLTQEKLNKWESLGIGEVDGKSNYSFLNATYMNNVAKGTNTQEKLKYTAMDMVFNSFIANAEMHKLFIGDPALYAKFSSVQKVSKNLNISEDSLTKKDILRYNLKESFVNLGKRLAGEIAPGIELANSSSNYYKHVFFADTKINSHIITDPIQNEYFSKIIDINNYADIEGSDAQEYTTWKEHLYVLEKLGRISSAKSKKIAEAIEKGKVLEGEDLEIILQPIKPVYVGNILEEYNNLDRRIYIKSSSFPLLPQLTAGLEIDKIREALEKLQKGSKGLTIRASFGTANKVGASQKAVQIFDKSGKVLDDINIEEEHTLILPRSNFRIQQDVPYKEEKSAVNVGTQESVLLFVDILDEVVSDNKTGADLQKKYMQNYDEIYKESLEKLSKKLGLIQEETINTYDDLFSIPENTIFEEYNSLEDSVKGLSVIKKQEKRTDFIEKVGDVNIERMDFINKNFNKIITSLENIEEIKEYINIKCD